jgi:nicotinamide-nucleotide amidase
VDVVDQAVDRIAQLAREHGIRVAAAESLTAGALMSSLGAGEGAGEWFAGGVVAYDSEVKFDLLGVDRGPVVTHRCAEQMASGVARLTGAAAAVAVTGVGGPGPEEDQPAGTVFVAIRLHDAVASRQIQADGRPDEIVRAAVEAGLLDLLDRLERLSASVS